VAEELDEANIYVWDGNYYALAVTTRLGLRRKRRYGAYGTGTTNTVVYNTVEKIKQFGEALGWLARSLSIR